MLTAFPAVQSIAVLAKTSGHSTMSGPSDKRLSLSRHALNNFSQCKLLTTTDLTGVYVVSSLDLEAMQMAFAQLQIVGNAQPKVTLFMSKYGADSHELIHLSRPVDNQLFANQNLVPPRCNDGSSTATVFETHNFAV